MPSSPETKEAQWLDDLAQRRSEVAVPGYWKTIADNCAQWAPEVSAGPYWARARSMLDRWRTEYRLLTGADLLVKVGLPDFLSKPENSIKEKLFRRCQERSHYIDIAVPQKGPPIPRLGDLVRTRVECQFIDGVEFLATRLENLANEMTLNPKRRREGRIDGYFAQHLMVSQTVLYRLGGYAEAAEIKCEVQVASDMASRMWGARHRIYESARLNLSAKPEEWQWDPTNPRFIASQLGHTIHLADGLLIQLRDTALREGKK